MFGGMASVLGMDVWAEAKAAQCTCTIFERMLSSQRLLRLDVGTHVALVAAKLLATYLLG